MLLESGQRASSSGSLAGGNKSCSCLAKINASVSPLLVAWARAVRDTGDMVAYVVRLRARSAALIENWADLSCIGGCLPPWLHPCSCPSGVVTPIVLGGKQPISTSFRIQIAF